MNSAKTLTALLGTVVFFASAGARADDMAPNRREAMRRFKEGMAAYGRGDFEQARLSLLQAYTVVPDAPNLAWDLALAEEKTHHGVDALRHFRSYLKTPTLTDKERTQAQKHIEAVSRETGHLTVTAEPGTLVSLDGNVVGTLAEPLDTEPGTHVLEAHKGAQSKTLSVAPQAGETLNVDLRIPDEAPPAPPAPVPPVVAAPSSSATMPDVPPPAEVSTGPSPATRIVVTSVIGVGAVTSVVLGVVFSGQASSDGTLGRSLIARCQMGDTAACTNGHNAAEDQAHEKNVATGLYIGGGVLAGAAVASWFLLAPKTKTIGAIVVPDVTPSSAGCVVRGSF